MSFRDEMKNLLNQQCSFIFIETFEEEYVVNQLLGVAKDNGFDYFQWSIVDGLRHAELVNSYYQSKETMVLLQTIYYLLQNCVDKPAIFILKDFHKYLENDVVLRLFKTLLEKVGGTRNILIVIGAEYALPKEVENYAVHVIGGYPDEQEIHQIFQRLFEESARTVQGFKITLNSDAIQRFVSAMKGLTIRQINTVYQQCIASDRLLSEEDFLTLIQFKKTLFDREGILEFYQPEDCDSVAGFDNLKKWLKERERFFRKPDPSLPTPKGVLLMGVQGCGKSLAVKMIADLLELPLYRLDLGKLYTQYVGESEKNLRKTLDLIDKLSPLCLWIDEIEKGIACSDGQIDGGVSLRILSTLLTWMQERKSRLFIAATANNVYSLPPELLRKGRFDEVFFVDLPDLEQRRSIFSIHLKRLGLLVEQYDLGRLAEESVNFSGAEIEQVIISAIYRVAGEKDRVGTETLIEQIHSTKPLAVFRAEDVQLLREWAKERTIPA